MASQILRFSFASTSRLLRSRFSASGQQTRLLSSNDDDARTSGFSAVHGDRTVRSPFDNPGRKNTTTSVGVMQPKESVKPSEKEPVVNERIMEQSTAEPEKKAQPIVTAKPKFEVEKLKPVFQERVEPQSVAAASSTAGAGSTQDHGIIRRLSERFGLHIDENLSEEDRKREKTTRNTKVGAVVVFGSTLAGIVWFCFHYGRAERDEAGNVKEDEFSGKFLAPFHRILHGFSIWKNYVVEPSREVLLPDPIAPPYHQPKYTLVIEVKNVLMNPEWSYKDGHRFKKRPALDYFLDVVGYPNFEVVIYTSESSMTVDPVINSMDPNHRVMYRLYRDCTKYIKGHHVKDLSKLNRDLSKVIYIDFDPQSFQLNPDNVLRVPKWEGNMNDTALVDLAELLKTIHLSDVEDVRPTLQYYSQFDDPAKEFRNRAIHLAEQEAQRKAQADQQQQGQGYLSKYSGWFGGRRHRV
ncbi:hypothetical protein L596_012863 [Steinernema carpocapsae]|uniref:Mitochondrial import inner membrane translocase subunit TIM50 n=1 Tax=Steinernema carpocapsae TaxID=34508 RepID=A0A4V6A4X4_STECR|nr:hypothetical protein L596_012863 [Steinernema carpocapsae]